MDSGNVFFLATIFAFLGLKTGHFCRARSNVRIVVQISGLWFKCQDFVNSPFVALEDIFDLAPLDRFLNFSFLSYGPKWPKMAIFGRGRLRRESTPNFGPISMKLGLIVRFTKKWPWTSVGPVGVRITEKRPFVRWAEKGTNGRNSVFRYINTPKTVIPR